MAFAPNVRDAQTPMGEIECVAPGTSILLNSNWTPKWDDAAVTEAAPQQYAYSAKDIIMNFNPNNAGGVYLVKAGGSKNDTSTIIAYFPKVVGVPQEPQALSRNCGAGPFAPYSLAVDFDQAGDKVWPVGIND